MFVDINISHSAALNIEVIQNCSFCQLDGIFYFCLFAEMFYYHTQQAS